MKQRLARLFKSLTKNDRIGLSIFMLINLVFCLSYGWIRLFLSISVKNLFPLLRNPSNGSFTLALSDGSPAMILTDICLMLIMQIWTGLLISKLRVWLISLPIQYLLYFVICYLVAPSIATIWAQLVAQVLVAQIPAVAVGLLIRYLIRKIRARKQATPIA